MSAETQTLAEAASKLVLVVEDDPGQLELTKYILGKEGFRLSSSGDGRAAVDAVQRSSPDLIVLDLMLPGLGGYEFIRELQAAGCGGIPIVVLTARILDPKLVEMFRLESNVKGFHQKPATPALGRTLHSVLGTRRTA